MKFFRNISLAIAVAFVFSVATLHADNYGFNPVMDGLTITGYGQGVTQIEGAFSVSGGNIHYWNAASGYHVLDTASNTVMDMGAPDEINTNFGGDPFGVYDAANQTFYAATFANGGESCLYSYNYNTAQWSDQGSAINMYGGAVSQGNLYISGLRSPWSGGFDTTYISLYDMSPSHTHDALIEVGGASAHLAVGGDGYIYYASYGDWGSAGSLYRWSPRDVARHINDLSHGDTDTYLTLDDAELLSLLPAGGNGIAVDDDGTVFVTVNQWGDAASSGILCWSSQMGTGEDYNYEMIASADPSAAMTWFGPLAIEGSFLNGDALYTSSNFNGHIVGLTVPEPASVALLAAGTLVLLNRKRNR